MMRMCSTQMASKSSVKAQLKTAKAAVGKKDYNEVSRICQEIFSVDEENYMGHVFAGLAELELGRHEVAKQHYKNAITTQPNESLAWKGLGNFYDKHPPSNREEVEDAILVYQTLLPHITNDLIKKRSTLSTLAALHHTAGHITQMVAIYSALIDTYSTSEEEGVSDVWVKVTTVLLNEKTLEQVAWDMLVRGVEIIIGMCDDEMKLTTRQRFIPLLLDKYKVQYDGVRDMLWGHCVAVLDIIPSSLPALTAVAYLTLLDVIKIFPDEHSTEWVTDWTKAALERFHLETVGGDRGGEGGDGEEGEWLEGGLGCIGMACVLITQSKWNDACQLIEKGMSLSPSLCEANLLLSWTHLKLNKFSTALQHAHTGLSSMDNYPTILTGQLEWKLKLLEAKCLLGVEQDNHTQQALSILMQLFEKRSCDRHVIVALTRAHVLLGNIEAAEKVVQSFLRSPDIDTATANMLQGEMCLAQHKYDKAVTWFDSVLDKCWLSECLLFKALALWNMSDTHASYATLLKAAKANPYSPVVMLYIGHYQRQVARDVSRALKCYQKAVQLQPDHVEALSCAGDLLFTTGREEEAFDVYSAVTRRVPPARAKHAWLRLGLYRRQKRQFNEAIYCFQKSLTADTNDKQCWECLAEAYLARGSHTSALRTFAKVVELDPESVYCLYQLGNINQVRGELCEAVAKYSAVLALHPNYLPALKGRGHTHYLLALSSLRQNFDARAVDHVSLALADLTRAASIKPRFLCVWKLIGNCCTCLYQVHHDTARPVVPEVLKGEGGSVETTSVVEKTELFLIGCRSFARGLQLSPECSSLWHDLALAYYHLAQIASTDEKRAEYILSAFSIINKALTISPVDHTHWNLLGVIATHPAIDRPAVAQHAFITSLQQEANNGLAWTNLGALYLKHGHIQLANKAFTVAQSQDPGYVAAWIGQAIIAQNIGHADCMDLYRHTTELDYHSEGSRGYGYWVCHTLTTLKLNLILKPGGQGLSLIAQRGLLQARDCLQRLVERDPGDGWAYNLLGLLYEQEGLLTQAEKAFYKASELLEGATHHTLMNNGPQCVAVSMNRARILSSLGRHFESLELWSAINPSPSDLSAQLQLALALYRAGKYADSLQVYERAVGVADECHKSAVLCACAMVAYAKSDIDMCKTFLFRAFETIPPSLHALVGLCVIGCLTHDLTLLQTSLLEMSKIIEWKSEDGQVIHNSCLLALKIIMNINQVGSECMEAASTVLNQLPDKQQFVEPPPLPLTLPLLANSSQDEILVPAQKLYHSYPGSVWSTALLSHAIQQNSIKSQYRVLLSQFIDYEISLVGVMSQQCCKQTLQKLLLWLSQ